MSTFTKHKAYFGFGQTEADDCGEDPDSDHQLRAEVKMCLTMDSSEAIQLARDLLTLAIEDRMEVVQIDLPGFLEVERAGEDYEADGVHYREVPDDSRALYPFPLSQIEPGLFVATAAATNWVVERFLVLRCPDAALLVEATSGGREIFTELPIGMLIFSPSAFGVRIPGITIAPGETVRIRVEGATPETLIQLLVRMRPEAEPTAERSES